MSKLEVFMKGRPHDKDKDIEEATMEYIEKLEDASVERYRDLRDIHQDTHDLVGNDY